MLLSVCLLLWGHNASTSFADETQTTGPPVANMTGEFYWSAMEQQPRAARRAWEARPYQVAVWVCHRGQPQLVAVEQQLFANIETGCELLDASSWFVKAGSPPAPTRNFLLNAVGTASPGGNLEEDPLLKHYDKLMVVRLDRVAGVTDVLVREYDLQTGQWGPIVQRRSAHMESLGTAVAGGIAQAFMPLAKIDRIDNKNKVHIRARATETCVRVSWNNELDPEIVPVTASPVYVRDSDRFLPIIRKTDRSGNLISLDPIEFTFLTIDSIEENELIASIHSSHRAPLAQRKSKRAQKLAVVVRPVERPTLLHLQSRDKKNPQPLEGYEVWARRPEDTKEVKSKFLGKTDWKGNILIPPGPEGLRLIYIKRGARALRKIPVIPGFKDRLVSQLPNDDARLFAEGVIRGYSNEIINLVVQRELLEQEIESMIDSSKYEEARGKLLEYKDLETPADMKRRMSNEEVRLKAMTGDEREAGYITEMFQTLKVLLETKVASSREIQFQEQLQNRTLGETPKK